ncbi:polyphosphate kinase 1 [Flectobacillus major]|uniref:polyphosphate kinase 1 n=1 Tax=Flectobacillus major TaxID=103 RepID=UPI000416046B|nr:polyphosphate kinase 1 [Flectobacillus major]
MSHFSFFDRDISWLYFNERVLQEAQSKSVPLLERIKFLAIYSSNLDEFYRVRIPALIALKKIAVKENLENKKNNQDTFSKIQIIVNAQLQLFGKILSQELIPELRKNQIHLVYNEAIPEVVIPEAKAYFFSQILAFLQPIRLSDENCVCFPENNKLYALVDVVDDTTLSPDLLMINIPSEQLPRFFSLNKNGIQYILFLEDIIKTFLPLMLKRYTVNGFYNFKITRDADLSLEDDYKGDLVEKMEKLIAKRDFGYATRCLYDANTPNEVIQTLVQKLNLRKSSLVAGGVYHNSKDFASLPIQQPQFRYDTWKPTPHPFEQQDGLLLDLIQQKDMMIHAPYQSYDTVLRFFNEAAMDTHVEEIYVTLYRVASDSRIVNALISAAKNGKKVTVLVELKARFDEGNNIKWAKKMKAEGVKIIYSIPSLKVHAKIALIKKKQGDSISYLGLLATGNLNESTARFYTDHILLTSHQDMLDEMKQVFHFLSKKKKKPAISDITSFQYLLVAQFNLLQKFVQLIDQEIANAKQGLPASITIKLNNLEEQVLIQKLYEASNAGVKINLIVRGICCLIPEVAGMSEHIKVHRIIDKYLEHGRIFVFHNNGQNNVFMGSSDWMNRNIYRRIEVCFPIFDPEIKNELLTLLDMQWQDNLQAVQLSNTVPNIPIKTTGNAVRSQEAIYEFLKNKR